MATPITTSGPVMQSTNMEITEAWYEQVARCLPT
jgi:hypothetical protein